MIIKSQVLAKLGYSEDAHNLLTKIQLLYGGNTQNGNFSGASPSSLIEKIGYVTCTLSIAEIEIEFSNFELAEEILDSCKEIIEGIFNEQDYELESQIAFLRLLIARSKMDLTGREAYAIQLEEVYRSYDHYRLMKSNQFIEFVRERILFLIDNARFDAALVRVTNIITILTEKSNPYWYRQFALLKARCYLGLRLADKGYKILQPLIPFAMDRSTKLIDYRFFVDLHLELSDNYFTREEYKNSLKCLKYVQQEYYQNTKINQSKKQLFKLKYADHLYRSARAYRKMSQFKKGLEYIEESLQIIKQVFPNENRNLNFCQIFITRGKIYCDMSKFDAAASDFHIAFMIYQKYSDYGEFCAVRLGGLCKELGNVEARRENFQKALQYYKDGVSKIKEIYPDGLHKSIAAILNDLSTLCASFKKYDLAEEYINKAIVINKKLNGNETVEMSTNYHTYGCLYYKMSKYDKAIEYLHLSVTLSSYCLGSKTTSDAARTLFQIGKVYLAKKDLQKARKNFKEALLIFRSVFKGVDEGKELIERCENEIKQIDRQVELQEEHKLIQQAKLNSRR